MMGRKLICVSVIVYLISTVVVALPSKTWDSSGWTTESSHRSGWENTEVKYPDAWKQTAGDDSQGKGWVSSEGAINDSKPKSIPTSWQQVDRHHGGSAKSSGWMNVGQKTSQDIANGFVVHHPIPSTKSWNQAPSQQESWNKQNPEETWPKGVDKKTWEKAVADAEEQWQQNQTPDVPKSSWDTKLAWQKSPDASSTSVWNKNSSPSAWENDALHDRESAAGYAATGPAQYGQESSIRTWQEKPSNNNGWQKNSPSIDAWKKDSSPSTLYDAPSKWNSNPKSVGHSEWQKASVGWDGSSDYKTWQKETTDGWADSASNVHNYPAVSGWQQGLADVSTQKPWQEDSASSGWQKSASGISNGWDKHSSH